jgi:hypothetical protein
MERQIYLRKWCWHFQYHIVELAGEEVTKGNSREVFIVNLIPLIKIVHFNILNFVK